jgi:hypothetical protein
MLQALLLKHEFATAVSFAKKAAPSSRTCIRGRKTAAIVKAASTICDVYSQQINVA